MSIFKIFLKNFKSYLFNFSKMHRTYIFLIKFKSKFQNKILSIDNIFTTREEILTQIIMQKKIMKRSREVGFDENYNDENYNDENYNDENYNDEKKIASKFDNKKFENRSNRLVVSKLAHNDKKSYNSRSFENRKRSQNVRDSDEKKNHYFYCNKSNH